MSYRLVDSAKADAMSTYSRDLVMMSGFKPAVDPPLQMYGFFPAFPTAESKRPVPADAEAGRSQSIH